jgi:hypothetical protein
MFNRADPAPEPFNWGKLAWASEEDYDKELAKLLGDLACGTDVPSSQTEALARRALESAPGRIWPRHFAKQVVGPDCLSAKALSDDIRRQLRDLAALG